MRLPTTAAMVQVAQDRYDVAASEHAVAEAQLARNGYSAETMAKAILAEQARYYAWTVLVSVQADHHADQRGVA